MGSELTKAIGEAVTKPLEVACRYCCDDLKCHSETQCEHCPCACDIETHAHQSEDEGELKE